jgi:hypothetical protein
MLVKTINVKITFLKLFLIIVVIPIVVKYVYYKVTQFEKTVYVEDKFTNELSFYENGLLFIKDNDGNIFNVTNLFFKWDFNKEEDYKKLQKGRKYLVKGYGKNFKYIPFYKNIYEVVKMV